MMKRFVPFLLIYVLIQQGGQTTKATWTDGQPVNALLQNLQQASPGMTYQIVAKAVYDAVPEPVSPTAAEILAELRASAINELTTDPSGNAKVIRAVFQVELDEINLIRSLLVPTQPARTVAQFRTAVQNKINSGAAD